MVFQPTRGKNILDLLLTNNSESITNVCINDNIAKSDHNVIYFTLLKEFDFRKYKKVEILKTRTMMKLKKYYRH